MKRLLLTTVSALALISARPSLAADLGTRLPVKAPPAMVRAFSWTGCYLGGHVGWGWGQKTFADTPNGDLVDFFIPGPQTSMDFTTNGFLGGGQIGCDYQFATNWVVGVEGNFSWADISGSNTVPGGILNNTPLTVTADAKTDWLASVTGRLGYAWDHWLLYAKGGAAWAHDKYNFTSYLGTWAASQTRSGWTVGGGLEWAFTDNWSTKLEYQFYDFGNRDVSFINGSHSDVENVKQQIQTVKLGLNYRFSGLFH
jgi:outer membrane immunogenic protein